MNGFMLHGINNRLDAYHEHRYRANLQSPRHLAQALPFNTYYLVPVCRFSNVIFIFIEKYYILCMVVLVRALSQTYQKDRIVISSVFIMSKASFVRDGEK